MKVQHTKKRILCLIPAKGGSTRLRRKNLEKINGKSLVQWAIDVAVKSRLMDRIVVSTEDEEIAAHAMTEGADVPFIRPDELASDPAGVVEVALHAIDLLRKKGDIYEILFILLPTCPFRIVEDLRGAFRLFEEKKSSFLMSVTAYDHSPFAALKKQADHTIAPYFLEYSGKKSQELPIAYRPNGAIHIVEIDAFEKAKSYYAQPLHFYEMPPIRSIDIDNVFDLTVARAIAARHSVCKL